MTTPAGGGELSDDQLIGLLAASLSPSRPPTPEGLAEVRRRAAQRRNEGRFAGGRSRSKRYRRAWLVPVVAFGVVVAGAGSAFAAGVPVTVPFHALASALGLQSKPSPVTSLQEAQRSLRDDLHDKSLSEAKLEHDMQVLVDNLKHVNPQDRSKLAVTSHEVLAEACRSAARLPPRPLGSSALGVCGQTGSFAPTLEHSGSEGGQPGTQPRVPERQRYRYEPKPARLRRSAVPSVKKAGRNAD
jgi:hypothetical protein